MKSSPFLLAAAMVCAPLSSCATSDPIRGFVGKAGPFDDTLRGVSATVPKGWVIASAGRWANDDLQTTISFRAPNVIATRPSLYYKKYPKPAAQPGGVEDFLRKEAASKAQLRLRDGFKGYKIRPESVVFRYINGYPALSFSADYTDRAGKQSAEYNTRVVTEEGAALFFMLGESWEVEALKPEFESMIATVHLSIK